MSEENRNSRKKLKTTKKLGQLVQNILGRIYYFIIHSNLVMQVRKSVLTILFRYLVITQGKLHCRTFTMMVDSQMLELAKK